MPIHDPHPHQPDGRAPAHAGRLQDPAARPDERPPVSPSPPGTSRGDRQLVRAAALGDGTAWELLVGAHADAVWTWCRTAGLRPDEARAASELVWRRLADALPDLGGDTLVPWLRAVTDTECAFALARARAGHGGRARSVERRRHARSGC